MTSTIANRTTDTRLSQLVSLVYQAIDEQDRELVTPASWTEATDLGQLPLDSLATVELIYTVEEHFGVTIAEQDAYHFTTISDVLQYIERHVPS